MEIGFTVLGKPISVNHGYMTTRYGGFYMSKAAKQWKKDIGFAAMMARKDAKLSESEYSGEWDCQLKFYWNDKRRRDAENCVKFTLDALQGIFYDDDKQVTSGSWFKGYGEPRVEIVLSPK